MSNIAQGKPYVGGKNLKLHLFHWEVCFFPTCSSTRLTHFHDFQGPSSPYDPIITYLLVVLISWDTLINPSHICFFGNIALAKTKCRGNSLWHTLIVCARYGIEVWITNCSFELVERCIKWTIMISHFMLIGNILRNTLGTLREPI
jgi:hypothetical protein